MGDDTGTSFSKWGKRKLSFAPFSVKGNADVVFPY